MRTVCGAILSIAMAYVIGAAVAGDSVPVAKMPETKHVFSMSCKVTACNGDLATAEGRAKAIAWWKKNNITKLWLESYRTALLDCRVDGLHHAWALRRRVVRRA